MIGRPGLATGRPPDDARPPTDDARTTARPPPNPDAELVSIVARPLRPSCSSRHRDHLGEVGPPAPTETYDATMFDIVHELDIAAPPDQVFAALTAQEGLAAWWTPDVTTTAALGSEAVFGLGDHQVLKVRIEAVDAPELVHWSVLHGPDEWPGTAIAFRIEAGEVGTSSVVRLWHGNWQYENGVLPRASFAWAHDLDRLRQYLETGEPQV